MSQTSLDYLFQVTGVDRSFAVPRADEPRPPFDELFSAASASKSAVPFRTPTVDDSPNRQGNQRLEAHPHTADDANGRLHESSKSETATAAPSNESSIADDGDAEREPPAHDSQPVSGASEETAKQTEDEKDIEDDSTVQAEAAGAQATAQKHTQVAASAEAVDDVTVAEDITSEMKEAVAAVTGSQQVETGARDVADAVDAIREEPIAASTGEHGAQTDETASGDARGAKKSRRTGAVNRTAAGHDKEGQDSVAAKEAAVVSDGELNASDRGYNAKTIIEQLGGEHEQPQGADEAKRAHQDRTESQARTETSTLANKAVVAASVAATTANKMGANAEGGDKAKQAARPQAAKSDVLAAATGRLHAQPTVGKRAARGNAVDAAPHFDPARFVGRVAKAFQTAQDRGGTLQLRLSPPELGALRLELTVKDGVMTASLETENASARRVLLDHLPALRERLAEQNIRVERFDVDVRREGGGQEATPQNQHHERQQHSESRRQPTTARKSDEALRQERPVVQPLTNPSGINLVA